MAASKYQRRLKSIAKLSQQLITNGLSLVELESLHKKIGNLITAMKKNNDDKLDSSLDLDLSYGPWKKQLGGDDPRHYPFEVTARKNRKLLAQVKFSPLQRNKLSVIAVKVKEDSDPQIMHMVESYAEKISNRKILRKKKANG